jgi:hypothetical protein
MVMGRRNGRICRAVVFAGVVLGATASLAPAMAGECPADKVQANVRAPVDYREVGVTDAVLASNDLAKTPLKANGRVLRLRRLVIQPGGIVPGTATTISRP